MEQIGRVNRTTSSVKRGRRTKASHLEYQQRRQAYLDHMRASLDSRCQEIFERRDARTRRDITIEIELSAEDTLMDEDCAICLVQHKMTEACSINCGHQFGSVCLAKWKKDTCPLCRTQITETTVFIIKKEVDIVA